MAKLVETYSDRKFVQTVSAQIPWFHNIAIWRKSKIQNGVYVTLKNGAQ